ncbi:hypothetical protein MIDIC_450004 [Alphaproteobacteria bacterium]
MCIDESGIQKYLIYEKRQEIYDFISSRRYPKESFVARL